MATTTRTKGTGTRKSTTKRKSTAKRKVTTRGKSTSKRKVTTRGKSTSKRKVTTTAKRKLMTRGKATSRLKAKQTPGGPASSISKAAFHRGAKLLKVQILAGSKIAAEFELDPREFSSGSFGWFASEKLNVPVGNERVRCQLSLNVTVIGSKNSS